MIALQLEEIQGFLLHGYKKLKHCSYLLLKITDSAMFKTWLASIEFQNAKKKPGAICFNISFTASGLTQLGVNVREENGFSIDFIEGMDTSHKNRLLGDLGQHSTDKWDWGSATKSVDCLLMIFSDTPVALTTAYENIQGAYDQNGVQEIAKMDSELLEDGKEHFGFKDGISQPQIISFNAEEEDVHALNPGEFILGYDNIYNVQPLSPRLHNFDFGSHGTYMVVRQLEQNVSLFWKKMMAYGDGDKTHAIEIASKIVGRWPNGKPLVLADKAESEVTLLNDFGFSEHDKHGYKCPIGAHIRRTNPRDSLDDAPKQSTEMVNRHRILRRGRPYGPPVSIGMETDKIIETAEDQQKRGLVFVCLNTDISRQFEFIQNNWVNNKKFNGLYHDIDPLIGSVTKKDDNIQFEIQATPFRKRISNIPEFVNTKGGAYFFLPSIQSIKYLSQ